MLPPSHHHRRLHSKATAHQDSPPLTVTDPYITYKLPSVHTSIISEDNLYQVIHPEGTHSCSCSPLPPSASTKVGGEIQHYAEGFGNATRNLQQEGNMVMGNCAAMLDLPRDRPPVIKIIDSEVECD